MAKSKVASAKAAGSASTPSGGEGASARPAARRGAAAPARARAPLDTRIDVDSKTRAEMVRCLNVLLAEASDATMQAKTAHWNVKGPHFYQLHKLFDDIYERLSEHVDAIAERIATLGGEVRGRLGDAASATRLPPFPEDLADGMAFVSALADALGGFADGLREGSDAADEAEDEVTADMLDGITAAVDKDIWFLEAHLR